MAEKGDRFIIEIDDIFRDEHGKPLYIIKGFNSLVFDEVGIEKLNKYDKIKERKAAHDLGYEHGLEEAWVAAGKIECDIPIKDIYGLFGYDMPGDIFKKVAPWDALREIRKYEERKSSAEKQLNIGDIVVHKTNGKRGIVLCIRDEKPTRPGEEQRYSICIMTSDNIYICSSHERSHEDFIKINESSKELLGLIKFLDEQ